MIMNRLVTIIALLGGGLSFMLALAFGAYIPAIAAGLFFFLSIFVWKYGYLLLPHFTKAANIVEVRGEYTIPPERDYILKKSADRYYATKFLEISFYESSMDKSDAEKRLLFESFEKVLSALKHPLKVSFLLAPVDVSKYVDDIKARRSEAAARVAARTIATRARAKSTQRLRLSVSLTPSAFAASLISSPQVG